LKTLKLQESGLILAENFDSEEFDSRLKINAIYNYEPSYLIIENGEIVFDIFSYTNCVIDIANTYIAATQNDFGGIRLKRGNEKIDFVEHYIENSDAFPRIKIIKEDDIFYGKGTNDLQTWIDKGYVHFHSAESVAVIVNGNTEYQLNSFYVYKHDYITIYGVLNDWELKVNDISVAFAENGEIKFFPPTYPFSGNFKIYDGEVLICEYNATGMWGGDSYECAIDVDILNEYGQVLPLIEEQQLGKLENGYILRTYYLRNNTDENLTATIKVTEYSPFYDWAGLSFDEINPIEYEDTEKILTTELFAYEEKKVYLFIKRPSNAIEYDYDNKQCTFFLEVD
jgi:hypothetical protein